MTAKEMFEELGLKQNIIKRHDTITKIKYYNNEEYDTIVEFSLVKGKFETFCSYYLNSEEEQRPGFVDKELYKAIQKQIEELGWEE